MIMRIVLMIGLMAINNAFGAQHQMIDTLGASPKGQYVAVEEYGMSVDKQSYYVVIKIMNVWQKKYVGSTVRVEIPVTEAKSLKDARDKAKFLAQDELIKFKING